MDKLTAIKIKYNDGTYSDEIPISALAENVEWNNSYSLVDILGEVAYDTKGSVQDQISQLFNEKVSTTDLNNYVASQLSTKVTSWLNENVDPVGSAVVVDNSLTISGAAADAQYTGTKISFLENGINWWASNDSIFYNKIKRKQTALKHIRDIQIFTKNKNDTFTLTYTYTSESGDNLIIHIKANQEEQYYTFTTNSMTPTWVEQVDNNKNRFIRILCDINDMPSNENLISALQFIKINQQCIKVFDDTLSESFFAPSSKIVGEKINDIKLMHPYQQVTYNWTFLGTQSNPLGWVVGNFLTTTGEKNSQTFYIRTLDTVDIIHSIPGAKKFTITAPEGYAVHVCEYNRNDDSFIKAYGYNDIRSINATNSVTVHVEHNKNYKFAVGRWENKDASSYITEQFINSIKLIVYTDYDINYLNDYYFPYLDNIVNKINNKSNEISNKSFGFIFITDHHYLRNAFQSPKIIHYLLQKTGIHTVIFGGDAFQNWENREEQNKYINMVYSMFENCGETNFFCVTGNHEWNDWENQQNTQSGINSFTTNRQRMHILNMDEYGNYYFDDIVSKTRIFCLSTNVSASLPWTSISWLGNSLSQVPDGYNVMVIAHAGVLKQNGTVYQKNTYMNISKLLGAFDRSQQVDLYNSESTYMASFDYTNKNGTTICYLCGHTHEDMHITKEDDQNGVLLICTTGDLYQNAQRVHYTFVNENEQTITRNVGTIYEQAFDVIQIDPIAKKVYCTRVGAGVDREFSY